MPQSAGSHAPFLLQTMAVPLADDTATNVTVDDPAVADDIPECTQNDFECVDGVSYCLQGVSTLAFLLRHAVVSAAVSCKECVAERCCLVAAACTLLHGWHCCTCLGCFLLSCVQQLQNLTPATLDSSLVCCTGGCPLP